MWSITPVLCVALFSVSYGIHPDVSEHSEQTQDSQQEVHNPRRRMVNAEKQDSSRSLYPHSCYSCIDCPVVTNTTGVKMCPLRNPKCVTYAEMYSYTEKPIYIRGCLVDRGSCEEINKSHNDHDGIHLVTCYECSGDKCNSNGAIRTDLTAAVLFLIVTPLLTKHMLS